MSTNEHTPELHDDIETLVETIEWTRDKLERMALALQSIRHEEDTVSMPERVAKQLVKSLDPETNPRIAPVFERRRERSS